MDYTSSSYSWFDKISSTLNLRANGFILIDSKTGLCLDVRGIARKEDAARLFTVSKEALDESGNGVVEFRKRLVAIAGTTYSRLRYLHRVSIRISRSRRDLGHLWLTEYYPIAEYCCGENIIVSLDCIRKQSLQAKRSLAGSYICLGIR